MKRFPQVLTVLWLAIAFECATAQARVLESAEETKRAAEGIVASLAASNVSGALAEFKAITVSQGPEFEVLKAQVVGTQEKLLRDFGPPLGYEYVRQDAVGTRVLRHQFLVFYENAPMVWYFVFYKQSRGWAINHVHFDVNALKLFPQ